MRGRSRRGLGCIAVAVVSVLVTATVMSTGFSFYLSRQTGAVGQHRARLKAATDRNAMLQSELLKLNSSVAGVMTGLDTVSRAVNTAKAHLQLAEPGTRGHASNALEMSKLSEAVQGLQRENELLKAQAARLASQPAPALAFPAPAPAPAGATSRWLTIGIPTVPRKNGERYLEQTVNAIAQQLPLRPDDPLFDRVIVVVLNNKPGTHAVFDQLKAKYSSGPYARYFHFVEVCVCVCVCV